MVLDVAGFDSLHHQSGRIIVRLEYERKEYRIMRMYAIYDKEYGYIGTTELDMVEVRALENDDSLIVIPV